MVVCGGKLTSGASVLLSSFGASVVVVSAATVIVVGADVVVVGADVVVVGADVVVVGVGVVVVGVGVVVVDGVLSSSDLELSCVVGWSTGALVDASVSGFSLDGDSVEIDLTASVVTSGLSSLSFLSPESPETELASGN